MWNKKFWKDTAERVVSTAAQAAIGLFTANGVGATDIDPKAAAIVVGTAALVSFLKALVANKTTGDSVSPASLVQE